MASSARINSGSQALCKPRPGWRLAPLAAALTAAGFVGPAAALPFVWFGGAGSWDNSANWTLLGIPGASDEAIIGGGTVTLPGLRLVRDLTLAGGAITGGALDVTGSVRLQGNGTRTLSGGVSLSTRGVTDWSGNTSHGGNSFEFSGNATINNAGTWNDSNAFDTSLGNGFSGSKTFNNAGRYNKLGAGNTSFIATLVNTGSVDVQAGRLSLTSGATHSGSFNIAAGSTLSFGNAGSSGGVAQFAASQLSGSGQLLIDASNFSGVDVAITGSGGHAGLFTVANGQVDINGSFSVPSFVQTGGIVAGSGTFAVNGSHVMNAGYHAGPGTTQFNGDLVLSNGTRLLTGGRVVNTAAGTTTSWGGNTTAGGNSFEFSGNATINNAGTWNDSNAFDTSLGNGFSGSKTFNNAGRYNKLGAGNTSFIATLVNTGSVDVQAGRLSLTSGATHSGSFNIATGSTLSFGNAGSSGGVAQFAASQLSGSGQLLIDASNFSGVDVAITGSGGHAGLFTVANGQVDINGSFSVPSFVQTGGIVAGSGTFAVNGSHVMNAGYHAGPGTTQFNGDLVLSNGTRLLTGGRVVNTAAGTTTSWGGNTTAGGNSFEFSGNATINNAGTWNDSNAFDTSLGNGFSGSKTFNNAGRYNKLGAGNTSFIATLVNTGSVDVQAGRLSLTSGATHSGSFNIAAGSTLSFGNAGSSGGVAQFAASQLSGSGQLLIDASNFSGVDVAITGSGGHAGLFTVANGQVDINGSFSVPSFVQTGGIVAGSGTFAVNGSHVMNAGYHAGPGTTQFNGDLVLSNGTRLLTGGRVVNTAAGTTTSWGGNTTAGGNSFEFSGNATINNAGTWNDSNAFDTSLGNGFSGSKTFNNAGRYNKLGAGNTSFIATLNNTGAVVVDSGRLTVNAAVQNSGLLRVAAGATFHGNSASFSSSGELRGNGTLQTASAGRLLNSGLIAPGDFTGTLTVDGDLTMAAGTRLQVELTSLLDFDRLVVTQSVIFAGVLDIVNLGYTPVLGESFIIGLQGQRLNNSTFNSVTWTGFDTGVLFDVVYNPTSLVLTVGQVPEPGTWALWLAGLVAMGAVARRRRAD